MFEKLILKIQKLGFQWVVENPFLFCAHHQDDYPFGNQAQGPATSLAGRSLGQDFSALNGFSMYHGDTVPGFPAHPHCGFETVTIVRKGFIDHFDSTGASGRFGNGDVQWLTTGRGCQHSEMFPLVYPDKPNPLELFQIWLNLPAKDKFAPPHYKMLWNEDLPEIEISSIDGKKTSVTLIAGRLHDNGSLDPTPSSWAMNPSNHVGIFLIRMDPEATITLPPISKTLNRNLYFYQGKDSIYIQNQVIPSSSRVKLSGHHEITILNGSMPSEMLLLEGEPIPEPVSQRGPFVMNTDKELQEAFMAFRRTQYGGWPWKRPDPVHPRNEGRFARYSDGTVERR
jgi:quercetin 2,3-dioxygenase